MAPQGAVLDCYSLEVVVQKLAGRKKDQKHALGEKERAKRKVGQVWEQLREWCKLPNAGLLAEQRALKAAVAAPGAFAGVMRQSYPWAGDGEQQAAASLPRAKASLLRAYKEHARCGEEMEKVEMETQRALLRCGLLEGAIARGGASTSEQLLLQQHLQHNKRLQSSFMVLGAGEVPDGAASWQDAF